MAEQIPAALVTGNRIWERLLRAHEVSILTGVAAAGRYLGFEHGAKTSMTSMRLPQQGHGLGCTRGPSGFAFSARGLSFTFIGAAASSARALAIFSARPPFAKRP